jgi:tetratricopeptide (TPR) repeat protein
MVRVHSNPGRSSSPPSLRNFRFNSQAPISEALLVLPETEAETRFRDTLASQYDSKSTQLYNVGITFLRVGEPEQAVSCFEDSLKLEPHNNDALKSLDLARKVIRILNGNEKFTTLNLDWMGSVANTARNNGMFEIALKVGEKMVQIDTTGGGALSDLGVTYRRMGNYEKAIECFDRALQIQPDMPEALSAKALCLMSDGKFDEATALYSKTLETKPDFIQGWYNLGVISMRKADYRKAIEFLDKAIGLNDDYYMAWFAKSQALKALDRTREAEECLKVAIELNPDYVRASLSGEGMGTHTSNIRAREK